MPMLMMINSDISRRRKQFYKRAMTLSSIPPQLIPEVENETDEESEQSKLIKSSPLHSTNEKHTVVVMDEGNCGHKTNVVSGTKNNSSIDAHENSATSNAKHRRNLFQARKSITISSDEPLLPLKDSSGKKSPFSKSPTSPSAILNKFKEKVQQSLFLSSTEWPSAAAILQERRKKANEHAKEQLNQKNYDMEAIHMIELAKKRQRCRRSDTVGHAAEGDVSVEDPERFKRCRMKSDPVVYSTQKDNFPVDDDTLPPEVDLLNRDAARDAFRRRSISEDTYDRLPPTYIKERKQFQVSGGCAQGPSIVDSSLTSSRSSNNSGGVICSNEDLHEILNSYKREKVQTPVVVPSRVISADVSKFPRQSYSSQASNTPSYVSQISVTSNKSNDSVLFPNNPGTSAQTNSNICDSTLKKISTSTNENIHIYPEVLLDSCKGKAAVIGSFQKHEAFNNGAASSEFNNFESIKVYQNKECNEENDEEDPQQTPPEIVFDEYGQTWDVYGAEFDPEILGSAIQRHLDKLMKKTLEEKSAKKCGKVTFEDNLTEISSSDEPHGPDTSSPKTLLSWWRFLCLFGTNNRRIENEPPIC